MLTLFTHKKTLVYCGRAASYTVSQMLLRTLEESNKIVI